VTSQRYRKKPVVIEAVQFTGSGDSCTEVTAFLGGSSAPGHTWKSRTNDGGYITTLEGDMEFRPATGSSAASSPSSTPAPQMFSP